MAQIKTGDTISVSRKFWKMPTGSYTFEKGKGRVMVEKDERPETCRPGAPGNYYGHCKCGKCLTETETRSLTVKEIIYFADNSTEAIVQDEHGNNYQVMLVAPHGDACF